MYPGCGVSLVVSLISLTSGDDIDIALVAAAAPVHGSSCTC